MNECGSVKANLVCQHAPRNRGFANGTVKGVITTGEENGEGGLQNRADQANPLRVLRANCPRHSLWDWTHPGRRDPGIPSGFRLRAQGCRDAATLGDVVPKSPTATRLRPSVPYTQCSPKPRWGLTGWVAWTQGKRGAPTLGWRPQSRWDCLSSTAGGLKLVPSTNSLLKPSPSFNQIQPLTGAPGRGKKNPKKALTLTV